MARFAFIGLVCAAAFAATNLQAQGIQDIPPPAELPPASYTGAQYVDSRGCAYIRAGRGVTTWVPRVTRSREQLCGLAPTLARATRPAQVENPLPVRRVQTRPAAPVQQPATRVVRAPAPVPVQTAPAPSVTTRSGTSACPGASASSQAYINTGPGVRCGPQQWTPNNRVTQVTSTGGATQAVTVTERKPKAVITSRQQKQYPPAWTGPNPNDRVVGTRTTRPADGYREVWDDDRLNKQRGLNNGSKRVVVSPAGSGAASYVQAGSFATQNQAARAANALRRQGLPAKVGVGRTRSVVLIGPYSDQRSIQNALGRARAAGLSASVVR